MLYSTPIHLPSYASTCQFQSSKLVMLYSTPIHLPSYASTCPFQWLPNQLQNRRPRRDDAWTNSWTNAWDHSRTTARTNSQTNIQTDTWADSWTDTWDDSWTSLHPLNSPSYGYQIFMNSRLDIGRGIGLGVIVVALQADNNGVSLMSPFFAPSASNLGLARSAESARVHLDALEVHNCAVYLDHMDSREESLLMTISYWYTDQSTS